MSLADKAFKEICNEIINYGSSDENIDVRPIWEDTGEQAHTIKKFGIVKKYDLRKEFPAITLRKTAIKSCFKELLWIWQWKLNDVNALGDLKIWDQWKKEDGTIGSAYGYQIRKLYTHHVIKCGNKEAANKKYYELEDLIRKENYPSWYSTVNSRNGDVECNLDQTDAILYDLRHNPYSRRIIGHMWNQQELHSMALMPCCWGIMLDVTPPKKGGKPVLNMTVIQRSSDVIVANNWNVCQYALLLMMFAQSSNMIAGELVHVMNNAHIYDRHIDIAKELINREEYPAPSVYLNNTTGDFYKIKLEDLEIRNYNYGESVGPIPVAK